MKRNLLLVMAGLGGLFFAANRADAQEVVVVDDSVSTTVIDASQCNDYYYTSWRDNWFLQLGAGVNLPFVENDLEPSLGGTKRHLTTVYNAGFGHWFSPYLAWRVSGYYGAIHWDAGEYSKAKIGNVNVDLMWDMFNSISGPNPNRVFSIVPYVGIGGTYAWDFDAPANNIVNHNGTGLKKHSVTLPVSAGIQLRFRLCKYVDFFLEARGSFYGDNFNNNAFGDPVDIDLTAIGGFTVNFGGKNFKTYNPCADAAYIASLNNQVNTLRGDLAATATALAVAESQLPCPEVEVVECPEATNAPMLTTVRFTINSSKISSEEMVNVYNVAEYLKANPGINVDIVGYADKDTGTAEYNLGLSKRRAQAVYDALTKTYGIDGNRLNIQYEGSKVQPYGTNNWNRIVIFVPAN